MYLGKDTKTNKETLQRAGSDDGGASPFRAMEPDSSRCGIQASGSVG